MDILSLIGLVLAFGAILGGMVLDGGHISSIM
ncbi:MAG: motility protein A, partial [Gammaproteobacteria bacterium]